MYIILLCFDLLWLYYHHSWIYVLNLLMFLRVVHWHKSHNTEILYPTMHHFITEMCTCVHISVTKWSIVGYLSNILWVVNWCKSHNTEVPYPTMHHFITEMCTCVHISVTKWCTVGYLSNVLWDLRDRSNIAWLTRYYSEEGPNDMSKISNNKKNAQQRENCLQILRMHCN